jgi:hypothetical protein
MRILIAVILLLSGLPAPGAAASGELTIDAPASLAAAADRIRAIDRDRLDLDLRRAGLQLPVHIDVTLIADADPRARNVPRWMVGFAFGERDVVIFPERVLPYPYDSLESVFRHEVAHLALTTRAGDHAVPRWFHEGLATSIGGGWGMSGQLRLLVEMLRRPGTDELAMLFASGTEEANAQAYGLSAALVADVQRRHGSDAPGHIAARVAAGLPFRRAFELETGESPDAAAARAWAFYRRWTRWLPALTSGTAVWAAILALAATAYVARRRRRLRRRRQWDEEDRAWDTPPSDQAD